MTIYSTRLGKVSLRKLLNECDREVHDKRKRKTAICIRKIDMKDKGGKMQVSSYIMNVM